MNTVMYVPHQWLPREIVIRMESTLTGRWITLPIYFSVNDMDICSLDYDCVARMRQVNQYLTGVNTGSV